MLAAFQNQVKKFETKNRKVEATHVIFARYVNPYVNILDPYTVHEILPRNRGQLCELSPAKLTKS